MTDEIANIISEVVDKKITQDRAIEISESKWWERASDIQIAYIQLHQDRIKKSNHLVIINKMVIRFSTL